jgi:hypothetical protein
MSVLSVVPAFSRHGVRLDIGTPFYVERTPRSIGEAAGAVSETKRTLESG